jgi:SAM-dependent methyltransferase
MTEQNRVQWVYSSKNLNELQERYDQWASDYDADLEKDFGWSAPALAAGVFEQYVPTSARVLDAGAGTGLVGVALKEKGYGSIVAMDLSEGMLAEARKTGAYESCDRMVMGETLGYATDSFDAVISVGVFTVGHVPPSGLDDLVRVVKPGGHIVYSLRPDVYVDNGFREKHAELEAAGKLSIVEATEPHHVLPIGEPEVEHQVWVLRVS